jgi:PLP dependent protein
MMIKENILKIRERVASACAKAGREPNSLIVIAVTKNRQPEEINEVIAVGLDEIGENRIQEAVSKYAVCHPKKWHMIGHLQSNKAKEAVKMFDLIHSVESLSLAKEIDKQAGKINKVQEILLEVNVSGEASKFGIKPEEALGLVKAISVLKNLELKGLMTVAPIAEDPQTVRPYFRALRELKDNINRSGNAQLKTLSMGMTDDFAVAIEEGATLLRLGRAIFEG